LHLGLGAGPALAAAVAAGVLPSSAAAPLLLLASQGLEVEESGEEVGKEVEATTPSLQVSEMQG
jgi:hypothetical protein